MLRFKAVEIRVGVVGFDSICGAGIWVRDWCAGYEGWEPFRCWAAWATDSEGVEGVVGFRFSEGIEWCAELH